MHSSKKTIDIQKKILKYSFKNKTQNTQNYFETISRQNFKKLKTKKRITILIWEMIFFLVSKQQPLENYNNKKRIENIKNIKLFSFSNSNFVITAINLH